MTTFYAGNPINPQPTAEPVVGTKRVMRSEKNSWRTSTLPTAISVAMLTGLAVAVALGFRELVRLAMAVMGG